MLSAGCPKMIAIAKPGLSQERPCQWHTYFNIRKVSNGIYTSILGPIEGLCNSKVTALYILFSMLARAGFC